MKRLLSILALASLAACGGGEGTTDGGIAGYGVTVASPEVAAAPTATGCTLTLLGDSILHGGYPEGEGVARLAEPPAAAIKRLRPAYTIQDQSKNGDSAFQAFPRLANEVPTGRIVVVEYGVNDSNGVSPVEYEMALRGLVQRVKSLGKIAIVTGLSKGGGIPNREVFNAIAQRVAVEDVEETVMFADWGTAAYSDADMLPPGQAHPGQAGSLRLVQKLVEALDAVAGECR